MKLFQFRAIQDQLTLIEKDSRCHSPVWIEQATQNALQPYVHLAKLFHQLLMRSRSLQPASNGEDEPPFTSVTKAPPNGHSPVSLNKSLITIAEPKEECRTPLGAHTFGAEPSQPSVISKQPTEQLVSTELSADQIFQALLGGNFGDIWRGKLNDGTDVAVKVWRISWLSTENHKILKRLTREIYNWSKTNHANVHQLLGVMMFQGRVGMVSRWMPNGNLQEYLSKHKTADRYQLCAQVSKGVQYLHAKSIIHGDLKAVSASG
ncbi:hypothetical protein OPQ81_003321 [Rhizoctonia solani]|nr:hypothetical protein OPQ81_003321 [Rhizoctonia solani]